MIKYVLGTANLGAPYGITNQEKYNSKLARSVLKHALSRGINSFDTAAGYGNAEQLIGSTLNSYENIEIVTKIPARESYTFEYVSRKLQLSLKNLRVNKIYGLMFHDPDIHKKNEIVEISKRILETGTVEHLGFSAYSIDELLKAKEANPCWTIFQVPENILDQRLINSTELADMARAENIFHVRSIFLQGLLLSRPNELPRKFLKYDQIFRELHLEAARLGGNSLDLCVSYASSITWSAGVIVAAASPTQLDEILNFKFLRTEFDLLGTLPEEILDPRRWGDPN